MTDGVGPIRIYLDTNVVSYFAPPEKDWFLNGLQKHGIALVVSDCAITEFKNSDWRREEALFKRIPFLFIRCEDELREGSRVSFFRDPSEIDRHDVQQDLDRFLQGILLWLSANRNAPSMGAVLAQLMETVGVELVSALSEMPESQRGILPQLTQEVVGAVASEMRSSSIPAVSREEVAAAGLGPRSVASIRPPHVLQRVYSKTGANKAAIVASIAEELKKTDDLRMKVKVVASYLLSAGFARDQKLSKDDPNKSWSGARSQANDVSHIAGALACHVFLTGDKRCACLAYACYEYLGSPHQVWFLDPNSAELDLKMVGEDFWPL